MKKSSLFLNHVSNQIAYDLTLHKNQFSSSKNKLLIHIYGYMILEMEHPVQKYWPMTGQETGNS